MTQIIAGVQPPLPSNKIPDIFERRGRVYTGYQKLKNKKKRNGKSVSISLINALQKMKS